MRIINLEFSHYGEVRSSTHRSGFPTLPSESLQLRINFYDDLSQKDAIALATDTLIAQPCEWFISGGYKWTIDLGKLKRSFKQCSDLEWLNGKISVQPDYRRYRRSKLDYGPKSGLVVTLMPEDLTRELLPKHGSRNPEELLPSLSKFRKGHPDPIKTGFIIMRFTKTKAHKTILRAIKSTLSRFSLHGLRSDDKEYSDELLTNIRTYMHGSGFGIAVFERLEEQEFNPNMSLEVGYMMAQGKPVLLLKDKTLKNLHSDIVGKLYRDFDPQDPEGTIPPQLESWLRDKGLI